MNKTHFATQRLIDSVWTLEYEQTNPGNIKIISYSRDNPIGYEKEKEFPRLRIKESNDGKRTVLAVYFSPYKDFEYSASTENEPMMVVNSAYIFHYPLNT